MKASCVLSRFALLLTLMTAHATAAERNCMPEGADMPPGWTVSYPAFRVLGNLYAVGTADLGVFLITTPAGHILVNTALEDSTGLIRQNIESLGFKLEDVRVLLTMQAHFDHTAALAEIKALTGAQMWATAKDARVLSDGGASDAQFGECLDFRFASVSVDRVLTDGEVIEFGGMRITTHLHPGHTEGSSSYSYVHQEDGRDYRVLLANMATINEGKQLVVNPTYPGVADDFANTLQSQKAMRPDVWVAAHGSHYGLADKHRPGQPYRPETFVDPEGFRAAVERFEQLYLEQLEKERSSAASADGAQRCTALANATVPASAIRLPTRGARVVAATAEAAQGEIRYCRVLGEILAAAEADPSIRFQVNLPERWVGTVVQHGGGGLNGTIPSAIVDPAGRAPHTPETEPSLLERGYAAFGGDSGHQSEGQFASFDAEFVSNETALANYRGASVARTRDAAVHLVTHYYGAAPQRVYFVGGSKGGAEGLVAAQRYADGYDGVVAYYPANNTGLLLSWQQMWRSAYRQPAADGGVSAGYLNPAEQQLLKRRNLEACDALDGIEDGLISNSTACAAKFRIEDLRCEDGANASDECLSDQQIAALESGAARWPLAFPLANHLDALGEFPVYLGADLGAWLDASGSGEATSYGRFLRGAMTAFMRVPRDRVEWFDYRERRAFMEPYSQASDATDPNIDAFHARGAKLILVQGTTDMLVPQSSTDRYYRALRARYGGALPEFVRYFVVPGFGHGFGDFLSRWDALAALTDWVERGKPPLEPVVIDANRKDTPRSRPLCEFPRYPHYRGDGSPDDAASFQCGLPTQQRSAAH